MAARQIVSLYKNGHLRLKDRIHSMAERKLRKTKVERSNSKLHLGELMRQGRNWKSSIAYGETKKDNYKNYGLESIRKPG